MRSENCCHFRTDEISSVRINIKFFDISIPFCKNVPTPLQVLENWYPSRTMNFCRFILNPNMDDVWFLLSILWINECNLSLEGTAFITYIIAENPHLKKRMSFQPKFHVNGNNKQNLVMTQYFSSENFRR